MRPQLPKETSARNPFSAIPLKKRSTDAYGRDTEGFAGFDDVLLEDSGQTEVCVFVFCSSASFVFWSQVLNFVSVRHRL